MRRTGRRVGDRSSRRCPLRTKGFEGLAPQFPQLGIAEHAPGRQPPRARAELQEVDALVRVIAREMPGAHRRQPARCSRPLLLRRLRPKRRGAERNLGELTEPEELKRGRGVGLGGVTAPEGNGGQQGRAAGALRRGYPGVPTFGPIKLGPESINEAAKACSLAGCLGAWGGGRGEPHLAIVAADGEPIASNRHPVDAAGSFGSVLPRGVPRRTAAPTPKPRRPRS